MKRVILPLALIATSIAAYALPTYEPFTEFAAGLASSNITLVVKSAGGAPVANAGAYLTNCLDLATGGYTAPGGEQWGILNFSGTGSATERGLDIAVISNTTIFTSSALTSLLPSTFPGFPASGGAITNFVENPAQPVLTNGATTVNSNYVGNSAVLKFAQDITRPTSGTKTVYVSYLFSVAQNGQLGTGNVGRYLAFLASSNLSEGYILGTGPVAGAAFTNWSSMFNEFDVTSNRYVGHGLLQDGTSCYIGACDSSTGKDFSSSPFVSAFGAVNFVVGAYTFNATSGAKDTNSIWVNPSISAFGGPTPPLSPVATNAMATNMSDIGGLCLIDRVGNGASGGVGTNYIANLLIGSTWSYVTGGPEFTNQPVASTNVNIGQNLSLTAAATAAGQSVSYQWVKIAGGVTNTVQNGADGTGSGGTASVGGAQTSTLLLTNMGGGDIGDYQLVAQASSTLFTLNSSTAVVGLTDPQIVSDPANTNVLYSGTATFTAQLGTANAPLNYRWYFGSTPLNNGAQPDGSVAFGASGTTGAGTSFTLTLTLTNVSYQDIGSYTLYATNSISLVGATLPATLGVLDPAIVTQPVNPLVAPNGNATFTVVATGSPTPSTTNYQWFEGTPPSGTMLTDSSPPPLGGTSTASGSQTPTLTLTGVTDPDNGKYYCAITGSASGQTTNSAVVTLTVGDPLTVVATPTSLTERVGDHLAFAVTVTGGGPLYQWYGPAGIINGANSNALVLTNIQTSSAGTYSVVVSNAATPAQTYSATLTVINSTILPLASTNLIIARIGDGAQLLSSNTGNTIYLDQYTTSGTYVSTVQVPDEGTGKPYGTGGASSASLPAGSPALLVAGAGNDAPYEAMLTLSANANENLCFCGYCQAYPFTGTGVNTTTAATGGSDWRGIALLDAFGVYTLTYTNSGICSASNEVVHSAATTDGTNFWVAGEAGSDGLKFVATTGAYANGSGVPAIASSASGPRVVQIVNGNFVFSDDDAATPGLYYNTALPAETTSAILLSDPSMPLDFAFSPDGQTLYIADGAGFQGTGAQAGGIQRYDTNTSGPGWVFSYSLPVDPTATLGALGLAVDFSAAGTWGQGVTGAKLYATTYGSTTNTLISMVDNGSGSTPTVLVMASPKQALRGVRFGPAALPPSLGGPQSQTNFPGNNVTFSVNANGSAPFYYQWYGPAGLLVGATNSSFTTNGISFASAGTYSIVVSNLTGTSVTNSAVLTVTAGAPVISPAVLPNYTETVGDHLAWAPIISGSVPITNYWYESGNPTPILIAITTNLGSGSGGLSLTNIQTSNAGTYSLVVSNLFGHANNTSGGVLTVTTTRQTLSSNNLVVARIGDGVQTLSGATGNTLYLDQYTTNGTYVNTIQYPDEGLGQPYGTGGASSATLPSNSPALLFAGTGIDAGYEAFLTLSPDGEELAFAGYCEAYPFSGSDVTTGATAGPNWRGIAEVDAYGYYTLNWTNTGLYSGGSHEVHGAVDIDGNGTNFYTAGAAGSGFGLKYCNTDLQPANGGGIASISGSFPGTRVVQVIASNIVFSDGITGTNGIYIVPGLPKNNQTQNPSTLLIPETNSPMDFAESPDTNTIYIADNGTFEGATNEAGGIQRWDLVGGVYTFSYTLATGTGSTAGARALTVDFSAHATWGASVTGAKLYVTTAEASGNRLIEIVDNGQSSGATLLATATLNQILAGIRFGPAVIAPSFAESPQSTNAAAGSSVTLTSDALGSGPLTYQWYFQTNGVGTFHAILGATNATYTIGSVGNGTVGKYYVIATSPSGATATSQTATVGVAAPPSFISEVNLGPGQGIQLNFTGPAGKGYTIWTTTGAVTLAPIETTWTQLTTGTFSGVTDTYTDPNGGASSQQYYIISVP